MDEDHYAGPAQAVRCPHCGEDLAGVSDVDFLSPAAAVPEVVIQHGAAGGDDHDYTFDAGFITVDDDSGHLADSAKLRRTRWLAAAVGAAVIALLSFVWATRPSSDPQIEASEAQTENTESTENTENTENENTGGDEGNAGRAELNGSQSGESPTITAGDYDGDSGIARWFSDEIDSIGADAEEPPRYAIVYPGTDGLRVLDADGLNATSVRDTLRFDEAVGLRLFTDGDKTWGVAPDDPFDSYIVSRNYEVVDMGYDGAVSFVNSDEDKTTVGISSFGGWGGGVELPPGTETLSVQGMGLMVLPQTGATLLLAGPGLRPFSDDRVVAGVGTTIVTQRCDEQLECGIYLQADVDADDVRAAPAVQLPAAVGERLDPSPDGAWVLATDSDGASRIIEVKTSMAWELGNVGVDAAAWAPDSAFVTWLAGVDLHVAVPSEQRQSAVTLPVQAAAATLIVTES